MRPWLSHTTMATPCASVQRQSYIDDKAGLAEPTRDQRLDIEIEILAHLPCRQNSTARTNHYEDRTTTLVWSSNATRRQSLERIPSTTAEHCQIDDPMSNRMGKICHLFIVLTSVRSENVNENRPQRFALSQSQAGQGDGSISNPSRPNI